MCRADVRLCAYISEEYTVSICRVEILLKVRNRTRSERFVDHSHGTRMGDGSMSGPVTKSPSQYNGEEDWVGRENGGPFEGAERELR